MGIPSFRARMGDPVSTTDMTSISLGHPVVEQFQVRAAAEIEQAPTGEQAAAAVTRLFRSHHEAAAARERGLAADLQAIAADDTAKNAMLEQVSRSVGREVEVSARMAARLDWYRRVVEQVRDLAESLNVAQPEVAERIGQALNAPAPPPGGPVVTVIIAFVPDMRWRLGWFQKGGEGEMSALPFAGWALVADSAGGRGQRPQAAFLVGGRLYPLTELERRQMILARME